MPEFTAEKPHAITCIKDSIQELLKSKCGDDLTISCDRDDCWSDSELFKHRQAINIVTQNDTILQPVKAPRTNRKLSDVQNVEDGRCWYDALLNVDIQIYVEQCDCDEDDEDCDCLNAKGKAYSILAHITSSLISYQNQLAGRRIIYRGSNSTQDTESEVDLVVVTASFEVHYLFDPTRPWMVEQ